MSARISVVFYIILCLEVGVVLTFLPWLHPFGLGDWGDNYFLLYAAQKTGLQGLQSAVSSGWVRGAVTGLGVLNFAIAFWEIAHFRQTVRALQGKPPPPPQASNAEDGAHITNTDHLPDNERPDDTGNRPG